MILTFFPFLCPVDLLAEWPLGWALLWGGVGAESVSVAWIAGGLGEQRGPECRPVGSVFLILQVKKMF